MFYVGKLLDVEDTAHLRWLPARFPPNVRCILSMVKGSPSDHILHGKYSSAPPLELPIAGLDEAARKEIAIHSLGRFNKVMTLLFSAILVPGKYFLRYSRFNLCSENC